MAVSATNLTTAGSNTNATSYATASITPGGNKLILAWVYSIISAGTANVPSLTGNGLTWEVIATERIDSTVQLTLFRTMGSNPTSGTVTIDFSGQTQSTCAWSIVEISGVVTTGTNGSGAIIQSAGNTGFGRGLEIILDQFKGNNPVVAGFSNRTDTDDPVPGEGFTKIASVALSEFVAIMTEFKATKDLIPSAIWVTEDFGNFEGIAVELLPVAVPETSPSAVGIKKEFTYKVYDSEDNFLTTWTDEVINEPSFPHEINSPGSEMIVKLGRKADDFGEGEDVAYGNKVKVYVKDKETGGSLLFYGRISNYTPNFRDEGVDISLLSFGEDMDNFVYSATETADISQTTNNDFTEITLSVEKIAQSFIAVDPFITSVTLLLDTITGSAGKNITIAIHENNGNQPAASAITGASKTRPAEWDFEAANFSFDQIITLTTGQTYWIVVSATIGSGGALDIYLNSAGGYSGGRALYYNGTSWVNTDPLGQNLSVRDLYFIIYRDEGSTTVTHNSQDPSYIFRSIINRYNDLGGVIQVDNTVDDTGDIVSYTFNTQTVLEAIQKTLELSPSDEDWYWYANLATNLIYFRNKPSTADHTFTLEKDVLEIEVEKRFEDIVNVIYFTGGGGLYRKYKDEASIALYGYRAMKYIDERVTVTATADTIADRLLNIHKYPEVRLHLTIADSNVSDLGYDIESINVGDTVILKNVKNNTGSSLWDVAEWDVDYWDFNIEDLGTLNLQIVRKEYAPDRLKIITSTKPPDVSHRIEDINRNLEASQTASNPSTPS